VIFFSSRRVGDKELAVGKNVLAVSDNRHILRLLARSLTPAGWQLEPSSFAQKGLADKLSSGYTMCIVDADGPADGVYSMLDRLYTAHEDMVCLLLSLDTNSEFVRNLLATKPLNNLVAKHGGISTQERIDETELIVTCQKLYARDIFGLEKYITTWGVQIHDHVVRNTADKRNAIRSLQAYLQALDSFTSIDSAVVWVADELLMNAMFDAPRDEHGNAKYINRDRGHLELEPNEAVTLRYCCDGRYFALSVTDPFGSLDRGVMLKYLNRCLGGDVAMEERQAGAGLGLYIVFNSITQLAFNIEPGKATEVVALFYIRSGPRAFNQSGKSLNIFIVK